MDLAECREWFGPLEKCLQVVVLPVESVKNVEHKGAVWNNLPKITKSVSHPFHLAAVITNGEITLDKHAKLGIKM